MRAMRNLPVVTICRIFACFVPADFASGRAWCGGPPENWFVLRVLDHSCLGSRVERRIILEHTEHDHGELARQGHLGLVGARASGDPRRPAFEFGASLDRLGQYEVGKPRSSGERTDYAVSSKSREMPATASQLRSATSA
jgi:hypothetical protein